MTAETKRAGTKKKLSSIAGIAGLVSHPLRLRVLLELRERVSSPAELAREWGLDVGNVSYHVNQLLEGGAIELVKTEQVRGATEHFYRAVVRPFLDNDAFAAMSQPERCAFSRTSVLYALSDALGALQAGSFTARPDMTVYHHPLHVDERGWKDLAGLFESTVERVSEIEAESTGRGDASIPIRVVAQVFEMPGAKKKT